MNHTLNWEPNWKLNLNIQMIAKWFQKENNWLQWKVILTLVLIFFWKYIFNDYRRDVQDLCKIFNFSNGFLFLIYFLFRENANFFCKRKWNIDLTLNHFQDPIIFTVIPSKWSCTSLTQTQCNRYFSNSNLILKIQNFVKNVNVSKCIKENVREMNKFCTN